MATNARVRNQRYEVQYSDLQILEPLRLSGNMFLIEIVIFYFVKLTIHCTPNLSLSMPK